MPSASAYDPSMGIYRKGKAWYYRLPRQPDGRRPSYKLKGVTTEAQAKAAARELALMGLLKEQPRQRTLDELRQEVARERAGHLKPATLKRYDLALRMLAQDVGAECPLGALTARRLAQWAADRLARGGRHGRGMSRAAVNSDLRAIRATLNLAVAWGYIPQAPEFNHLQNRVLLKEPPQPPRHLLPEEVDRVMAAEDNPERRRLWTFLLWTGCRRSEALALRREDLHWVGDYWVATVVGKGGKARPVPLLPAAEAVLAEVLEQQDVGPVFQWHVGGRGHNPAAREVVTPNRVSRWFKAAAIRAGVPKARLHDLRHTAVTYMLSRGVPPRRVQEVVGHASYRTTEGYGKALTGALYDALMTGVATGVATERKPDTAINNKKRWLRKKGEA